MLDKKGFLGVLQSVDAFFPIGAFTLSNGLEDYVVRERIETSEDLRKYMTGFLQLFPYGDLGVLSLAYRHFQERDYLLELDGAASAMKAAKEVRMGSVRMCSRYIKARKAMVDCDGNLTWYDEKIKSEEAFGSHPVALGIYGASNGIDQSLLLVMYAYSVISAIVNNTVKLVPLSQMDGQRILFEQMELLEKTAEKAMMTKMEDLGVSGAAFEIHCMKHEQLYSRQYMS